MNIIKEEVKISKKVNAMIGITGGVLIHTEGARCYKLNEFGARVWERLAAGKTLSQIVLEIAENCGIEQNVVQTDLGNFVEDLAQKGLLERRTLPPRHLPEA